MTNLDSFPKEFFFFWLALGIKVLFLECCLNHLFSFLHWVEISEIFHFFRLGVLMGITGSDLGFAIEKRGIFVCMWSKGFWFWSVII